MNAHKTFQNDPKPTTHSPAGSAIEPDNDTLTLRIPRQITLELPRAFQLEIPRWVGRALLWGGGIFLLSFLTRGAIWHFWWLIFFVPAFICGGSCSGKKNSGTSNRDHGDSSGQSESRDASVGSPKPSSAPKPTQEMYV